MLLAQALHHDHEDLASPRAGVCCAGMNLSALLLRTAEGFMMVMVLNVSQQPEPLEPRRDPDDLRNNLERRRQERTEGVKITIAGGSQSHGPLGPGRYQQQTI